MGRIIGRIIKTTDNLWEIQRRNLFGIYRTVMSVRDDIDNNTIECYYERHSSKQKALDRAWELFIETHKHAYTELLDDGTIQYKKGKRKNK